MRNKSCTEGCNGQYHGTNILVVEPTFIQTEQKFAQAEQKLHGRNTT